MVVPMFVPANYTKWICQFQITKACRLFVLETHIAEYDGDEAHAADCANGSGLFYPVVPAVCEYGYPAFCNQCLDENKHAKCEGDKGQGKVVEYSHGCREGFLCPRVCIVDERC